MGRLTEIINQVRDEVALDFCKWNIHIHCFNDMVEYHGDKHAYWWKAIHERITLLAMKQYAKECVKASLEKASNNATDKQSILNEDNIVLV